mmetsp:Transcript_33325/g.39160  ORF Transcript_33325/g.39160 Transcript_33325/m.39160 type:complete len:138 (+) Transcript_33325:923-1336(+)
MPPHQQGIQQPLSQLPQHPLSQPPPLQQQALLPQPQAKKEVPQVYSRTYDDMKENETRRVLAFLTDIQPSDDGKFLSASFRWLHSPINEEFTMNVFKYDIFKNSSTGIDSNLTSYESRNCFYCSTSEIFKINYRHLD